MFKERYFPSTRLKDWLTAHAVKTEIIGNSELGKPIHAIRLGTVEGTVSRIEPFGAFINVEPGIDGLIHSSKLDSQSELKKGDKITVNVESVDPDHRRMSLSLVLTEVPVGYK